MAEPHLVEPAFGGNARPLDVLAALDLCLAQRLHAGDLELLERPPPLDPCRLEHARALDLGRLDLALRRDLRQPHRGLGRGRFGAPPGKRDDPRLLRLLDRLAAGDLAALDLLLLGDPRLGDRPLLGDARLLDRLARGDLLRLDRLLAFDLPRPHLPFRGDPRLGNRPLLRDPRLLDRLARGDLRLLGIGFARGALAGELGALLRPAELDLPLLRKPRLLALPLDLGRLSLGLEIACADRDYRALFDLVSKLAALLDVADQRCQALGIEAIRRVEVLERRLVDVHDRHALELEPVLREILLRDGTDAGDVLRPLLVLLAHRHLGGDGPESALELAGEQGVQPLRLEGAASERGGGGRHRLLVGRTRT